ncbi:hypothetical protein [Paraliomyxa miuraensis]|uniref:hypothetical protein n=1 Tax=Paraliomyxa miuraensis TaxID=376150 RepID=UPI0022528DC0|nr:hypothetical protein [Paraliomyxa miuraensis]MCX4244841.1 hypothetical protein [Paraliomyxa miuraensis]
MRPSLALVTVLSVSLLSGCASAYKSFYRETDHQTKPKPVAAEQVKVVKSADDLKTEWSELGTYRGHAPTVKEAMNAAQVACGKAGADFFILYTEPYEAHGVWKVDGRCALAK